MRTCKPSQRGASLIEILVTILILSFGMLAMSGMLAYAVQMPKLSAYRATAVMLGAAHIERMRANVEGFMDENYQIDNTYGEPVGPPAACAYPDCTALSIAAMDMYDTRNELRQQLPGGGYRMRCNGDCDNREGDLWIMWQEPSTFAAVDAAQSDECPAGLALDPQPRCIHIRFRL